MLNALAGRRDPTLMTSPPSEMIQVSSTYPGTSTYPTSNGTLKVLKDTSLDDSLSTDLLFIFELGRTSQLENVSAPIDVDTFSNKNISRLLIIRSASEQPCSCTAEANTENMYA